MSNQASQPLESLQPKQNSINAVVKMVIANCKRRGKDLSSRQRAALDSHHSIATKIDPNLRPDTTINQYFWIFDDLFFGSNLACRITVVYQPQGVSTSWCEGLTEASLGPYGGPVQIHILTQDTGNPRDYRGKMLKYLRVLLHEMVHAVMHVLVEPSFFTKRDVLNDGWSGHGVLWQDMAYAVEMAARDLALLGLRLDLNRGNQLDYELQVARLPPDIDASRWDLNPSRRRSETMRYDTRQAETVEDDHDDSRRERRRKRRRETRQEDDYFDFDFMRDIRSKQNPFVRDMEREISSFDDDLSHESDDS